jgi:hypothetical protein
LPKIFDDILGAPLEPIPLAPKVACLPSSIISPNITTRAVDPIVLCDERSTRAAKAKRRPLFSMTLPLATKAVLSVVLSSLPFRALTDYSIAQSILRWKIDVICTRPLALS